MNPRVVATAYRVTGRPDEPIINDSGSRSEVSSASRQKVLKAAHALREMPPFAREREIDFGRYSNFSPQEQELLRDLKP